MASLTDYLADALVKEVFMGTNYAPPTNRRFALFTALPNTDGTGGAEVTGGGYARQAVTFEDGDVDGEVKTTADVVFTNMPACTVVGIGIFDATTGGNLLTFGAAATPRNIAAGETLTAESGTIVIAFQ